MEANRSRLARLFVLAGLLGISTMQATAQDDSNPFVVTEAVNINNFVITPIAIPQGMRLLIDYVSITGSASAGAGTVQPVVVLYPQLEGGLQNMLF